MIVKIRIFLIIITLGLSFISYSQTTFQKNKDKWDGWSVAVGYSTTDFLSPAFSSYIENRNLQRGLGLMIDIRRTIFPLMINFGLGSSQLSIAGLDFEYEGEEIIDNSNFQAGLNLYLIPYLHFFSPYVGAEYHKGFFAPGDSEINRIPFMIEDLSGVVFKFGGAINFTKKFGVSAEYKRSLETDTFNSFNQMNATLTFHF